jgi:hypothetical protein
MKNWIAAVILSTACCGGVPKKEVNRVAEQVLQDEEIATASVATCRAGAGSAAGSDDPAARACDDVLSRLKSIKTTTTNLKALAK